jgi:enoyl-CoA hydratase
MHEDVLAVRASGAVRVLTITRPERLNALNTAVFERLAEEAKAASEDVGVRVLVIAGSGPRAFSAGADLDELAGKSPIAAKMLLERGQRVLRELERIGKPVIAAVDGYALGGGLELALACSYIVASSAAKLGLPEVGLGLIPGYGGTQRLPRLIGRGAALRMMLSGDRIDAEEAFRLGILSEPPLAPEGFDAAVLERAERLAAKSPIAQRLILSAVDGSGELDGGLALETSFASLATVTGDGREGIAAFREKRKPSFTGELL